MKNLPIDTKHFWRINAELESGEKVELYFHIEIHDTCDSGYATVTIDGHELMAIDLDFDEDELLFVTPLGDFYPEDVPEEIYLKLEELGYDCSEFQHEYMTIQVPDGTELSYYSEPIKVTDLSNFELNDITDSPMAYQTRFFAYGDGHALTLVHKMNEDLESDFITGQCPDQSGNWSYYCEPMERVKMTPLEQVAVYTSMCRTITFKARHLAHAKDIVADMNKQFQQELENA